MASHGTSLRTPEPGEKFNRWTFIEEVHDPKRRFKVRCDCGTERLHQPSEILGGRTKSCGCYNAEVAKVRATKHGQHGSRLHWVWLGMRQRCTNPDHISFKNYGARGIKVCEEWDDFNAFRGWSLAHGYVEGATYRQTIDRVDPDGNYEPDNCRWVGQSAQMRNTRVNRMLTAWGETKTMMDWSEDPRCQVSYFTLRNRVTVNRWDHEEAISSPSRGIGRHR